jgi:Tfp pilus assembly protein FimT
MQQAARKWVREWIQVPARCAAEPERTRQGAQPAAGFTLAELVVGLSIATLLAALALPVWSTWLAEQRVQTVGSRLLAALQSARGAAIAGSSSVHICPAMTGAGANDCASLRDWSGGWLNLREEGSAWRPLRRSGRLPEGVRVDVNSGGLQDGVWFDASGFPSQGGGGFASGSWVVCAAGARAQIVTLASSGRVRISTGAACV